MSRRHRAQAAPAQPTCRIARRAYRRTLAADLASRLEPWVTPYISIGCGTIWQFSKAIASASSRPQSCTRAPLLVLGTQRIPPNWVHTPSRSGRQVVNPRSKESQCSIAVVVSARATFAAPARDTSLSVPPSSAVRAGWGALESSAGFVDRLSDPPLIFSIQRLALTIHP